ELLEQIFLSHPELSNIPIVANVDFGHTTPNATIPIGGTCEVKAIENSAKITILTH
ncbi:LD-carboxypeptidase, partial [bacterium]|nr:LD-carboxypeptidase [bacterium]